MNPEINLHIDRLILDGLPIQPGDERLLQAALEGELTCLLAEKGLPEGWSTGAALPAIKAAPIHPQSQPDPGGLGRQIAHSVYGSLEKPNG